MIFVVENFQRVFRIAIRASKMNVEGIMFVEEVGGVAIIVLKVEK
jgi:hypothetical protein